jgi:class 3 adenylate cyclase
MQDQGPPTGTVTCLFTDIEGSTRLELALGRGPYRDIRERHRELLREAFAARNGYEQSTEGDSFFVIFRRAVDAVAAAADGQRAIATEGWPDGVDVRVRMGIHSGEIERIGSGDVIGYDINRTARIAALAHGGQVLVSEATRALVAEGLPVGVTLRDVGKHRLKDLREPEHLAQLVIEDLQDTFPPLRSLDARPNNLPTQLTTFVGRERELSEALALLRSTRLLSLTGPGGTGKTRRPTNSRMASGSSRSTRCAIRGWWRRPWPGPSASRKTKAGDRSISSPTRSAAVGYCSSWTTSSR